MKKTLIAQKPISYGTRRLKADDEFTAPRRDADLLVRIGRARYPDAKPAPEDELTELRRQYEEVVGKRAYHGWNAAELRKRMSEAKD